MIQYWKEILRCSSDFSYIFQEVKAMKKFTFKTGGSWGRGDSWDGIFEFELTDDEAARLAESAKGKTEWDVWDFKDDKSVSDIYDKVYAAEYENELKNIIDCQIGDLIEEYLDDDDHFEEPTYCEEIGAWIKKAVPFTERELAEAYFENSSLSVGYPEELLGCDENEDEDEK